MSFTSAIHLLVLLTIECGVLEVDSYIKIKVPFNSFSRKVFVGEEIGNLKSQTGSNHESPSARLSVCPTTARERELFFRFWRENGTL